MGRRRFTTLLVALTTTLLLAVGVVPAVAGAAAQPAAPLQADDVDEVVLTATGPTGIVRTYTLPQLKKKFKIYKGYAGYVKTAFISMEAPHPVKGVRLLDVLAKVGYKKGRVTLHAADGYEITYTTKLVRGQTVTMYKAKPPKYPVAKLPKKNPLTALIAFQEKPVGARINDSRPWREYTTTYATDGSNGIGPLRFWWAYRKWVNPGFVQIGWSSMRMLDAVTVVK